MKITIAERFGKELIKLPPHRQRQVGRALEKFVKHPRPPGLDFRSLVGAPRYFIIDASGGDRIILKQIEPDHFEAVDVGVHDNVYRRWAR